MRVEAAIAAVAGAVVIVVIIVVGECEGGPRHDGDLGCGPCRQQGSGKHKNQKLVDHAGSFPWVFRAYKRGERPGLQAIPRFISAMGERAIARSDSAWNSPASRALWALKIGLMV